MGDIILYFMSLVFIVIIIFLIYRAIKKTNSMVEKITEILLSFVISILLLIYFFDRYNIASRFNFSMNINTQNWLSLIVNYITGIVSAIIGALVAVWTTIYQIKRNNEENERRDKENLRIQNIPIIKYEINTDVRGNADISELIITNKENSCHNVYNLNIIIKNIGLNSIKDLIVDFNSSVINNSTYRLSGKEIINPVEKGETIEINRFFSLKAATENYEMFLTVYYQDVLANWYRQKIDVYYSATNIFEKGRYIGEVSYSVKKEEIIKEEEIERKVL